ncbi:DoxX family protein [Pedobacter mucosus]|uniref:DoxX family protein n=1 Tax=Pedobacter mucosus TaxID=2895286 RepID=UPI001EE4248B|nr:DoxX family protein [Pedobacter mucosus]UKT65042.1 DoxX family protein [Pedobacter mucosus]
MKILKITYRLTTGIIVLGMVLSFYVYLFTPLIKTGFVHLGFPDWFRKELAIAKLLGALVLAVPKVPERIKEWAYAGFFINFCSASLAHYQVGDPLFTQLTPLFLALLLVLSYITYHRLILAAKYEKYDES